MSTWVSHVAGGVCSQVSFRALACIISWIVAVCAHNTWQKIMKYLYYSVPKRSASMLINFDKKFPLKLIIRHKQDLPLRRLKRFIFLGQGPVQGPREEVQGLCARARKRCARASGFSKILNSLAPLVVALAPNYPVYH